MCNIQVKSRLFSSFKTALIIIPLVVLAISCVQTNDIPTTAAQHDSKSSQENEKPHDNSFADKDPHGAQAVAKGPLSQTSQMASAHGQDGSSSGGHPAINPKVPANSRILVPPMVKDHWKSLKLVIEDKQKKAMEEYTVNLGDNITLNIGGKTFKIVAEAFLPDFRIEENPDGSVYTSLSNNPDNPAAKIHVFESDTEVFDGWLFSMFPSMHPFNHDLIGITFKEGLIRG